MTSTIPARLILFVLVGAIETFAQSGVNDSSMHKAEEEVRAVQDALIDAYLHRKIAALDRILADEFTFIDDDGLLLNKQQLLDFFKSGEDQVTSYKRQEDKVRLYGNVAIMTYRCRINETYKGQDVGGDFRITRIFVKRDGRWQIVGGQDTKVSASQSDAK